MMQFLFNRKGVLDALFHALTAMYMQSSNNSLKVLRLSGERESFLLAALWKSFAFFLSNFNWQKIGIKYK